EIPGHWRNVEIPGHREGLTWSVAWHPDGRHIASAGTDGSQFAVKVWDARNVPEHLEIQAKRGSFAVPFHFVAFGPNPDGRYLVTGSRSGAVQVWDATTGEPVRTLGTHTREIRGVVFSPDGKHLASASGDGEVKLWDATRLDKEQEPRLLPLRARFPPVPS